MEWKFKFSLNKTNGLPLVSQHRIKLGLLQEKKAVVELLILNIS